jgi:hypothetical protein
MTEQTEWFCRPRFPPLDMKPVLHARCGSFRASVILEGESGIPEAVRLIERALNRVRFAQYGWAKLWFDAYEAAP